MEQANHLPLLWIVLLPLAGAILSGLLGNQRGKIWVSWVCVGVVIAAFSLALNAFLTLKSMRHAGAENPQLVYHAYEWLSLNVLDHGRVPINLRFSMDSLSSVMTLVVTGIGGLIHLYAVGYMSEDKSFARFFSYLNLFTASMLILVLASNIVLMFVGWEGVGLCSYLLIGFWYENRDYAAAGRKAFVTNRIGDLGVLIGMFVLVTVAGSFEFSEINASASMFSSEYTIPALGLTATLATVATLFLFLGCTGKSAQIPLYVWLPDAMAGPTPVSALIHAATMVTAGVYLCCRLSPVFMMSPTTMAVIAVTGTLTALLAASIAVVQKEMKKILAYSTVSHWVHVLCGGRRVFRRWVLHVFTHAFFKACLFLGAGSVMHAACSRRREYFQAWWPGKDHADHALELSRKRLAIAGVPMFSGFSKDEILLGGFVASASRRNTCRIGRLVCADRADARGNDDGVFLHVPSVLPHVHGRISARPMTNTVMTTVITTITAMIHIRTNRHDGVSVVCVGHRCGDRRLPRPAAYRSFRRRAPSELVEPLMEASRRNIGRSRRHERDQSGGGTGNLSDACRDWRRNRAHRDKDADSFAERLPKPLLRIALR
ncbi:MAG: NADH-quinone oxidoreductase subunit L [Polyangiales bacterium]